MIFRPKGSDLKSISEFNSDWADTIALLILFGLLVDIGDVFVAAEFCHKILSIFANCLIITGVWGELWFLKRARSADDGRVAEANKAAEEAKARASNAELETQKLKAQFAWREITPEQQLLLRQELLKFTGGSVLIRFFMYDIESQNLAEDVGAIFRLALWKTRLSPEAYSGNFAFGFRISPAVLSPSAEEREGNRRAANAVEKAFRDANLDFLSQPPPEAHILAGAHGANNESPCAQLYVGPKPRPPIE